MNFAGPLRRGGLPPKYVLTDSARELILREYDSKNRRAIAEQLGVPAWMVSKWAVALGVARTKEKPWSADQIELLQRHAYTKSWRWLAKHTGRTVCAVKLKAKRLHLQKVVGEGYTQALLAALLGIDNHRVAGWIRNRWLSAQPRRTDRTPQQGGDALLITDRAVRRFIREHPERIDLRRVDKLWFIELAFGARAVEREEAA